MQTLTKKQKQVFDFINSYRTENGISPTIEEIRKKLKLRAVSTIHEHINTLKEKGYLLKNNNSARSITLIKKTRIIVDIPIIGKIAAGKPIEAIEDFQENVSVLNPAIKNPKDYYALRVVGDSMINDGIFNGDIVIIKKQSVAENGQTVVAIIDGNEATLKKLYRERDRFRLEPRNPSMLPLFRTEVEIRGVVIQIISNILNEPEKKTVKNIRHAFKTIDLFAGIGGIRLGFEKAGFNTVFANDFDEQCKLTYDLNFPKSKLVVEDIRKIGIDDLPKFDFLVGGFPCQAFSIAGYRQGFNDKKGRGNLFFDIARIIDARKPEGFLLENVKNLKSHDEGKTFKIIEETLKNLGYYIKPQVLNSMDYGNIPQNRERIYIVGFKNKNYADKFSFPRPIKLTTKITDLLEKNVSEKYYYNGKPLYEKLKNFIKEEGKVYQWRRQYVRENKSGVCPTLTANMGMGGHNVPIIKDKKGIRKLTPLECARIQGFPENYKLPQIADSTLYKQLGNSVSVPVIEAVAKQMMKAMG
ncbi:MAG: transcriptional repressor LexA [Candidatus Parcubacteria bacterium]|nr:transcriptional repressor LexA [Candidatus Parcubacteria bacterium]